MLGYLEWNVTVSGEEIAGLDVSLVPSLNASSLSEPDSDSPFPFRSFRKLFEPSSAQDLPFLLLLQLLPSSLPSLRSPRFTSLPLPPPTRTLLLLPLPSLSRPRRLRNHHQPALSASHAPLLRTLLLVDTRRRRRSTTSDTRSSPRSSRGLLETRNATRRWRLCRAGRS